MKDRFVMGRKELIFFLIGILCLLYSTGCAQGPKATSSDNSQAVAVQGDVEEAVRDAEKAIHGLLEKADTDPGINNRCRCGYPNFKSDWWCHEQIKDPIPDLYRIFKCGSQWCPTGAPYCQCKSVDGWHCSPGRQ